MLRQQRVFDRARNRRLRSEYEQQNQRQCEVVGQQGGRRASTTNSSAALRISNNRDARSGPPLARGCRKQKKRRDQGAAGYGATAPD